MVVINWLSTRFENVQCECLERLHRPLLTLCGVTVPLLTIVRIRPVIVMIFAVSMLTLSAVAVQLPNLLPKSLENLCIFLTITFTSAAFLRVQGLDHGNTWVSIALLVVALIYFFIAGAPSRTPQIEVHFQSLPFLATTSLVSSAMFLQGWTTLGPYVVSSLLAWTISEKRNPRRSAVLPFTILSLGATFSWLATDNANGQFIRSFDQLFRSAFAIGLTTWGRNDNMAAAGQMVPGYHWLSEATAGLISMVLGLSSLDTTLKVMPILTTFFAIATLAKLGTILGFTNGCSWGGAFLAISLSPGFKITTTGRSWGLLMFFVGLFILTTLWIHSESQVHNRRRSWRTAMCLVMVTPLIALTQIPLGVVFVAISLALNCALAFRRRELIWQTITTAGLQVLLLLTTRFFWLASDNSIAYTNVELTLRSLLTFDNLGIYFGSNRLFLTGQALLTLGTFLIMASGMVLLDIRLPHHRRALHLVGFVVVPTIFVVNVISSWWDRFFHPTTIVITFVSGIILADQLRCFFNGFSLSRSTWSSKLSLMPVVGLLLIPMIYANRLPIGIEKTALITAMISVALIVVLGLRLLRPLLLRRDTTRRFLWINLASALLLAHFAHIDGTMRLIYGKKSSDEIALGTAQMRDCLYFIKESTNDTSIIGSNWFRIDEVDSLGRRQTVSATTERRTFVDGPETVALPTPEWLLQRVRASDNFAENPTNSDYQLLKDSRVEYFLVIRTDTTATGWKNFATIAFANSECFVLELQ